MFDYIKYRTDLYWVYIQPAYPNFPFQLHALFSSAAFKFFFSSAFAYPYLFHFLYLGLNMGISSNKKSSILSPLPYLVYYHPLRGCQFLPFHLLKTFFILLSPYMIHFIISQFAFVFPVTKIRCSSV